MQKSAQYLAIIVVSLTSLMSAQQTPVSDSARKVVTRIAPTYPELAKRMHIEGSVKIEAMVRPNGSVRTTRVIGGNPVLVEAASTAVNQWKFEPAPNETAEVVQLTFAAH
jgi:TonB family protein